MRNACCRCCARCPSRHDPVLTAGAWLDSRQDRRGRSHVLPGSTRFWLIVVCVLCWATPVAAQQVPGGGGWKPAAGATGAGVPDGPRGVEASQTLGTATQTDNGWALAWEPTKYDRVAHHVLFVYGHSSVTGEERLATQELNIGH